MILAGVKKRGLWLLLPIMLAACALGDVPNQVTAPPPLSIPPAPSLILEGSCDTTRDLELWLQITTGSLADFQTTMNAAAAKTGAQAYEDTITMAQIRDSASIVPTPDCANDAQLQLTDTMNKAVDAFQNYVNGQTSNISSTVAELNSQFDQVIAAQNDLLARMNTQIQSQIQPTAGS